MRSTDAIAVLPDLLILAPLPAFALTADTITNGGHNAAIDPRPSLLPAARLLLLVAVFGIFNIVSAITHEKARDTPF